MTELGRFALYLAVAAAAWGAISGLIGARTGREATTKSAEGAVRASALALSVAAVALFYAFLSRDFSIAYVFEYSSRSLSLFYTVSAFWAGQPGSLLLWAWVLSLYGVAVVYQNRHRNRDLMPWVVTVLAATIFVFAGLTAFASNPFDRLDFVPADGRGLNPLLQNYGQFVHPVTLYMGFVGLTVPFAFCVAALATGRLSARWIASVRKWTLWTWILLTAGILLGARWAYVELGWGGYWAWDPVENASLMPWLMITAYLHSVMIQEKRGMLKVWNVFLVVSAFALSIFGTFITRSGVISSVHAFAQSNIGPFLLAAVGAVVLVSGGLIAWRFPELRRKGTLDSVVSRESSFLLNNVLLVGIAFAIFWGTVFPLLAQAVRHVAVSVGPPFYEAVVTPMGIALFTLVGLCPLLAWRKASMRNLRRNFVWPLAGGTATFVLFTLLTRGDHLGTNLVFAVSAFVTVTLGLEFYRGARARRRMRGERWPTAVARLFSKNPRRYGGYLIHLGVVVLLVGIAVHVAFKQEIRTSLSVGESAEVGGYTLTLRSLSEEQRVDRYSLVATMVVSDGSGRTYGEIRAEKNVYVNQEQPTTEVGIRSDPARDLYVILESGDPVEQIASFALLVNPGVFWVWVGALIVLGGGVLVAWPGRAPAKEEEVKDDAEAVLTGS